MYRLRVVTTVIVFFALAGCGDNQPAATSDSATLDKTRIEREERIRRNVRLYDECMDRCNRVGPGTRRHCWKDCEYSKKMREKEF